MRRYEYEKLKRRFPMTPHREPGNDPASPSVEPGVEVTNQGGPTISVTSFTSDADGGTRLISEEII